MTEHRIRRIDCFPAHQPGEPVKTTPRITVRKAFAECYHTNCISAH